MTIRRFVCFTLALAVCAFVTPTIHAQIQTAGDLLVDLRASHATAGSASWTNLGTLGGSFTEFGNPVATEFGTNDSAAVVFNGLENGDAYRGPIAPAGITGNGTRSVEVWAYNPALADEETLVSWSRRGGDIGTNFAVNYGSNPLWGAAAHWGSAGWDMGWTSAPPDANLWHHIVYTYDGTTARVYADSVLKTTLVNPAFNTHAGYQINLAAQAADSAAPGTLDGLAGRFSGGIGQVRIHDGVLSQANITNNFSIEAPGYGVSAPPPPPPPVTLVSLWQFNQSADLGNDSMPRNYDVTPRGDAAYSSDGRYGGAVKLDGNGDMLDRNIAGSEIPDGNESYTVAAWFKADPPLVGGSPEGKGISGWGNYFSGRQVNALRLFGGNGFRHYWWGADLDANDGQVAAHGVDVDDGQWHHITATYNNVTGVRALYLNGQLLVQDTPGPNNAALTNFAIGRTCCAEHFDGWLDDVAVFKVSLSADEIRTIMSGNFGDFGGPVPEPSTAILGAIGAVMFAWRARRRK